MDIMEFDKRKLDERYLKAQKRVEDIKGFYGHLISYIVIMPFLVFVNYMTYWEFKWFWFMLIGWGIGLAIHGFMTFAISSDWEERKIKQFMEEENNTKL